MTPNDGRNWLRLALLLMLRRPLLFISAALVAPAGSVLLLAQPFWDMLPYAGGWLPMLATVICYGLPLTLTVSLACGFARAVNRLTPAPLRQLLVPTVAKVLFKTAFFLFTLLLQGYIAVFLIQDLLDPAVMMADFSGETVPTYSLFGAADTILGTQLGMIGGLLLVMQLLFAAFAAPLHLFQEMPLYVCWRLSFLALQLNPWLWPALGLPGLVLILVASFESLSVLAQVLALPLPAYLGALLYVAWVELFQGGIETEAKEQEEMAPALFLFPTKLTLRQIQVSTVPVICPVELPLVESLSGSGCGDSTMGLSILLIRQWCGGRCQQGAPPVVENNACILVIWGRTGQRLR